MHESYTTDKSLSREEINVVRPDGTYDEPGEEEGPATGKFSPFINILNVVFGTGILALPYAFYRAGLVIGIFTVILIGVTTILSYYLLLWSADASGQYTYPSISQHVFSKRVSLFVKSLFVIDMMGISTATLLVIAICCHDFLEHYVAENSPFLNYNLLIGLSLIILVPLCLIPSINFLSVFSLLSMFPYIYLIILLVVNYFSYGAPDDYTVPLVDDSGYGFFLALPIINYSFASQVTYLVVYKDFKDRGGKQGAMGKVGWYVVSFTFVCYMTVGVIGVLTNPRTDEGLLEDLPTSIETDVALISLGISAILGYPVLVFVIRETLDNLLLHEANIKQCFRSVNLNPFSPNRFIAEGLLIIGVSFLIGVFIPSFIQVIGLFGAITKIILCQILPPVFYLKSSPTNWRKDKKKWLAIALLALGGFLGCISAVISVLNYPAVGYLD